MKSKCDRMVADLREKERELKRDLHLLTLREREGKREAHAKAAELTQRADELELALAAKNREAAETRLLHGQTLSRAKGEKGEKEREVEDLKARIVAMENTERERQESETVNRTNLELEVRVLNVKIEGMHEVLALREHEKGRMESDILDLQRELEDRTETLNFRQHIRKQREERSSFEVRISRQRVESIEEALRLLECDYGESTRECLELRTSLEQSQETLQEVQAQHQLEVRVLTARIEALQEDLRAVKRSGQDPSWEGLGDIGENWAGAGSLSTFGSSIRLSLGKEIGRDSPLPWRPMTNDPLGVYARASEPGGVPDEPDAGGGQNGDGDVIISADLCFTGPGAVAFSESSSDHAKWDVERDAELTMLGSGPEGGRCSPDLSPSESFFLLPLVALKDPQRPQSQQEKVARILSRRFATCSLLRCFYQWCRFYESTLFGGSAIQSAEESTMFPEYEQDVTQLREMQGQLEKDRRVLQTLLAQASEGAEQAHDVPSTTSSLKSTSEMWHAPHARGPSRTPHPAHGDATGEEVTSARTPHVVKTKKWMCQWHCGFISTYKEVEKYEQECPLQAQAGSGEAPRQSQGSSPPASVQQASPDPSS